MTAAVRKKDEELTINQKYMISVLMTDLGLMKNHTCRAHTGSLGKL